MAYNYEYPYISPDQYNDDWLLKKMIEMIAEWAHTVEEWKNLQTAFDNLKEYVDDYFDNLDLQKEVSKKLDEMYADGSLERLLGSYFQDIRDDVNELQRTTIKQGSNQSVGWNMLTDEVKGKMQSGEVPVIGNSDITTEKIADFAVTPEKTSFIRSTSNLFTLYGARFGYFYSGVDDTTVPKSLKYYKAKWAVVSGFIPVTKGVTYYTFRDSNYGSNTQVAFFDVTKQLVSSENQTIMPNTNLQFVAPDDGYVLINTDTKHTYGWYFGTENVEPYTNIDFTKQLDVKAREYVENSIGYRDVDFIERKGSYFLDSYGYWEDYYMNGQGELTPLAGFCVSHIFYMPAGQYVVHHPKEMFGSNVYYYIASDPLQDINYCQQYMLSVIQDNDIWYTFTLGAPCYVVFNFRKDTGLIINKFGDYSMNKGYLEFTSDFVCTPRSKIYGKSISLTGDSICAGSANGGGYGILLQRQYNMTVQNIARGGGTIASGTYVNDNPATPRFWINESIQDLNDNEYIIAEGGINDTSLNVPLGKISVGFEAALDTDTFYGGFENMLKEMTDLFNDRKLGFIFTHKINAHFNWPNGEYYLAAVECCKKWGIPYLDLNIETPPLNFIPSLKTKYTSNGDGTHPNALCYETLYLPKIVSFLESL